MVVFECAGCGAELTAPLSPDALPAHAHQTYGNGIQLPVLMDPGTFAVDPEPWKRPWRRWEAADGAPCAIVIAPGDARGTVLISAIGPCADTPVTTTTAVAVPRTRPRSGRRTN